MSEVVLRIALILVVLLFLIVEIQHTNLVEAVVERVIEIEKSIADSRLNPNHDSTGWYDGPKVSESCQKGAKRAWPHLGMTFILNLPFYFVVILIIVLTTVSLPQKRDTPPTVSTAKSFQN